VHTAFVLSNSHSHQYEDLRKLPLRTSSLAADSVHVVCTTPSFRRLRASTLRSLRRSRNSHPCQRLRLTAWQP